MALPDLTGQNIEDSYQRILHTDGTYIWDGTGSLAVLQYTGSFTGDGSGLTNVTAVALPAGPSKSVQFNDDGVTSGSGNFTFDKVNNILFLTGSLQATSFTGSLMGTSSWAFNSITASFIDGGTF